MRQQLYITTVAFLLPLSSQANKNVLLLIADDMRPELHEAYGQPWMVTPKLDKLARESLIFDAAFTNFAICAASTFCCLSCTVLFVAPFGWITLSSLRPQLLYVRSNARHHPDLELF